MPKYHKWGPKYGEQVRDSPADAERRTVVAETSQTSHAVRLFLCRGEQGRLQARRVHVGYTVTVRRKS